MHFLHTLRKMFVVLVPLLLCVDAPLLSAREEKGNDRVVEFSEQHLGQKVGNGECTTLASQALDYAGFKGSSGNFPNHGDYVWGRLVFMIEGTETQPTEQGKIEWIKPGDIVQFRNVLFQSKRGFVKDAHHTAVVKSVDGDKQVLTVLHQNFSGKKVTENKFDLKNLKKGWLRVYEPIPK